MVLRPKDLKNFLLLCGVKMQHKEILGGQDLDTWTTVKYIGSPANDELVEWCNNNGDGMFSLGWTAVWFKNDYDATLFLLRWKNND